MNAKDIEIAEKLLGWKLYNYDTNTYASPEDYDDASNHDGWEWRGEGCEDLGEAYRWSPSKLISHAMLAAKKVAGVRFKLEQRGTEGANWDCRIATEDGKHGIATAETECEAICGALLEVAAYKEGKRK